jgi:hydroxymethylpyrimidine pyrophosphatase-like HAD family hydrolase
MVLATLAARLHEWTFRQPASACTALELIDLPQLAERGALLFTSSGKHPDAERVLSEFRRTRFRPTVVVTHRNPEDLQEKAGADTRVVRLPALAQPDGFLATGSVLQMTVALLRAYLEDSSLADTLPEAGEDDVDVRREVLVLTSPALAAVAIDIEVRLVESGLASVQVADYRNFAHGRHTGFARRLDNVTVIALSDPTSAELASGTVGALPAKADVRPWHHEGPWPQALVALLLRSMRLAGKEGRRVGVDVARPAVPVFGRRLYRLPLGRRLPEHFTDGVERKLLALGAGDSTELRAAYRTAQNAWQERIRAQRFAAVVLDYDGTVCFTSRRRELPDESLRDGLQRLLDHGAQIGFASGRGQSLHRDLRRWLPRRLWGQVLLGLYNGAVQLSLDEPLPELRAPTSWSRAVVGALDALPIVDRLEIEERGAQVTVAVARGGLHHGRLGELVRERLACAEIDAQVVASGHSVDVISPETRKTAVLDAAGELWGATVLAIGDQGQIGGNDHALLARSPFSLTVDRCSADPTRCWYLGNGEQTGPDLLARYLRAMRSLKAGVRFTIRDAA